MKLLAHSSAQVLVILLVLLLPLYATSTGLEEEVRKPGILSIKLFKVTDQASYPIIGLGEFEQLELHFDDLSTSAKSYSYAFVLCNADWSPTVLSQMDYTKGFTQNRITQYRFSAGTFARYVHYQARIPTNNSYPSRSGNYLLKVFENGDTSKLLFSRRLLVADLRLQVTAQIAQPFAQETFLTHQKVITRIDPGKVDIFNPQQMLRVVVLQNHRWDNAQWASAPTFIKGKILEYNAEDNFVFEGGKEWRWLDLRSFRLQSDRVKRIDYQPSSYNIFVRTDSVRSSKRYMYFNDLNGRLFYANLENINPWWQSDYGRVFFSIKPDNAAALRNHRVYLFGELTGYSLSDEFRMKWNEETQQYENSVMLKNGWYNYLYVTRPENRETTRPSMRLTEGSVWDSENTYTVLVYYRPFGGRADELVGFTQVSSLLFLNPGGR
jgi:hypothetical protein